MKKHWLGMAALVLAMNTARLLAQESAVIAEGARLQRLASGFSFTEGPAVDAAGNVFFTDQPNDRIYRWSVEGVLSVFLSPCGRSNGLYFDSQGHLWACADEHNELWRIDPAGHVTVVINDFRGRKLNGPNDLWITRTGGIYFTDPFYQRSYWTRGPMEQSGQHVYYLGPDRGELIQVTTDLEKPNGIMGTPDGRFVYVADIGAGRTYRYRIHTDGTLTQKRLFCTQGSDGMTLDQEGNLYLTGTGVTVFNHHGHKIEQVDVPASWTANVTFGGADRRTLFITARDAVYSLRMRVPGASLAPDVHTDERVDLKDFSRLAQPWRRSDPSVDLGLAPQGDNRVDLRDIGVLAERWLEEVLPVDLKAYWKLDALSGDVTQDSAGHSDAQVLGAPLWQPHSGRVDGALQLDGADDHLITAPVLNPAQGPFSVFAWIKGGMPGQVLLSQETGVQWLMADMLGGTLRTNLTIRPVTVRYKTTYGPPLVSSASITDGDWHRIGFIWTGQTRCLYVDGMEVARDTSEDLAPCEGGLIIGAGAGLETGSFFSGLIDDVRIYDSAVIPLTANDPP